MNIQELLTKQHEIFEKYGFSTDDLTINRIRPLVLAGLVGMENMNPRQQLDFILSGLRGVLGTAKSAIDLVAGIESGEIESGDIVELSDDPRETLDDVVAGIGERSKTGEDKQRDARIDQNMGLLRETFELFNIFLAASETEDTSTWEVPPVIVLVAVMSSFQTQNRAAEDDEDNQIDK